MEHQEKCYGKINCGLSEIYGKILKYTFINTSKCHTDEGSVRLLRNAKERERTLLWSEKLRVGILGATGMVGQRFISLLENHPWFEVVTVAASPRRAGKTYEEAVGGRWKMDTPMPEAVKNLIVMNVNEVEEVASTVDFVFTAVDMTKDEIKAIEEEYAKTETPVVSNNSAHRWTPDVPMVVPEINPEHFDLIKSQKERLGTNADLSL